VLRRVSKRRELSTVAGVTLSGRILKRHFEHSIHGEDVILFLRHLLRHVAGPLILIWDRLNAHRAAVVKTFLAEHPQIEVEWLPPYAPDLNPEEFCHGNIKQRMRNAAPVSVEELRAMADHGFARLRRHKQLLLGFFHHAGYHVRQLS